MIRIKQTKKIIPIKIWVQAEEIACGLNRGNARISVAYGFTFNPDKKEIDYGEFIFWSEITKTYLNKFDGYIKFFDWNI